MAIISTSSFEDEAREASMRQEDDEQDEVPHHGTCQILPLLSSPSLLLQERLHEEGPPNRTFRCLAICDRRLGGGGVREREPYGASTPMLAVGHGRRWAGVAAGGAKSGCICFQQRTRQVKSWAGACTTTTRVRAGPQPEEEDAGYIDQRPAATLVSAARARMRARSRRLRLQVGPAHFRVGPTNSSGGPASVTCNTCMDPCGTKRPRQEAWCSTTSRESLNIFSSKLRLPFILLYIFTLFYIVRFGTHSAADLRTDREIRFLCPFISCCVVLLRQPWVPKLPISMNRLLLRCDMDDNASTWVFGLSFIYLRQRQQNHLSVVGMFSLRRLHRPSFNRRNARSVNRVHASLTPLRIPPAGTIVLHHTLVDAVVFYPGQRTLMYLGLPFKTSL